MQRRVVTHHPWSRARSSCDIDRAAGAMPIMPPCTRRVRVRPQAVGPDDRNAPQERRAARRHEFGFRLRRCVTLAPHFDVRECKRRGRCSRRPRSRGPRRAARVRSARPADRGKRRRNDQRPHVVERLAELTRVARQLWCVLHRMAGAQPCVTSSSSGRRSASHA